MGTALCVPRAAIRAEEPPPTSSPSEFVTAVFGTTAGVPQPIEDVVQTRDGYLWLATQAGVVRFDGTRFTLYRAPSSPGLQYNAGQCLLEDHEGSLWIGTDRGLSRYRNGVFEAIGSQNASITTLAEDAHGVVWIGTKQGVLQYEKGELRPLETEPRLKGKSIRDLFCDRSGRMWIATFRAPLLVFENGSFHVFEIDGKTITGVEAMAEAKDHSFWLSTLDNGVFHAGNGHLKQYGPEQGLGSLIGAAIYVDHRDNVWAVANGVFLLGHGGPDRFSLVLQRTFENFRAITEDREGNIWLGTHANGLFRVTPTTLRIFSDDTTRVGSLRSVTQDAKGTLWLGVTQQALTSLSPEGVVTRYGTDLGFTDDAYSEYAARDGRLWNGGRRALQIISQGKIENFPEYPAVRALYEDRSGTMWIAPETGPVARWRNGGFETVGGKNNFPTASADCFTEDSNGTLYAGLYRSGLVALKKDGSVTVQNTENGLPANDVRAVYADTENNLWLGTKGRGLAVFTQGHWYNPQAFSDLFQDQVSAIIEDAQGNLFLGTLKGVFYARKTELLAMALGGPPAHLHAVVLGDGIRSDSVYSSTQPVVWKAADGVLWFATRQGLFGVDPAKLGANTVPPPVYIERAVVDNRPMETTTKTLRLPAGTRTLAIEYTALGFTRPQEVLFRYKLEGYDENWIDVDTRRTAYYNNLAPGKYRFHVIACNDDGVWNDTGATLEVVQQPWFYQTALFRVLLLGVLIGLTATLYRWRVRLVHRRAAELQKQNAELERRISERTAELAKSYDALRVSEYFYHSLVESLPQIIARKDAAGRYTYANRAFSELVGQPLNDIIGQTDHDIYPLERAAKVRGDDLRVMQTGQALEYETVADNPDGSKRYLHVKNVPLRDDQEQPIGVLALFWDMSVFRETEEKLKQAQHELVETSRLAGMAEVATGVLHNIGNVLNSVNTSARIAAERIHGLKIPGVGKMAQLLTEQSHRLAEFFATDPRGQQLPGYMTKLTEHLERERGEAILELDVLQRHIEHIKEIVMVQQSHARVSGITEVVPATELVEYALRIGEVSLSRHGISVMREFMPVPRVKVERQKVLQILVNLIRNAKESMDATGSNDKRLILGVRPSPTGQVQIVVSDNGLGIAAKDLTRVFAFGFTTKKNGHGFGLHSSSLAAKEMEGTLIAQSDGPGKGATFILELPPSKDSTASGNPLPPSVAE